MEGASQTQGLASLLPQRRVPTTQLRCPRQWTQVALQAAGGLPGPQHCEASLSGQGVWGTATHPSVSPARAPLSWSGPQLRCRVLGLCWQWASCLVWHIAWRVSDFPSCPVDTGRPFHTWGASSPLQGRPRACTDALLASPGCWCPDQVGLAVLGSAGQLARRASSGGLAVGVASPLGELAACGSGVLCPLQVTVFLALLRPGMTFHVD